MSREPSPRPKHARSVGQWIPVAPSSGSRSCCIRRQQFCSASFSSFVVLSGAATTVGRAGTAAARFSNRPVMPQRIKSGPAMTATTPKTEIESPISPKASQRMSGRQASDHVSCGEEHRRLRSRPRYRRSVRADLVWLSMAIHAARINPIAWADADRLTRQAS